MGQSRVCTENKIYPKKQEEHKTGLSDLFENARGPEGALWCHNMHLTTQARLLFQGLLWNCNTSSARYTQLLHTFVTPDLGLNAYDMLSKCDYQNKCFLEIATIFFYLFFIWRHLKIFELKIQLFHAYCCSILLQVVCTVLFQW